MRVLVCDDHTIFCTSIAEALKSKGFFVDTCFLYDTCVELITNINYDVFICDLNIGSRDGFELVKELNQYLQKTRIIFLSAYSEPFLIDKAQKIGANAFLSKDCSIEKLLEVINAKNDFFEVEKKYEQNSCFDQLDKKIINKFKLSKQEKEIIKLICVGKTSAEIADLLFISKYTVDTHRSNIYKKLQVSNTASLIQFANLHLEF